MIEIKNINLEVPAFKLQDINLLLEKGDFFAILGPSGSGKTLILEAIAGLRQIHRGSVFIHGRDVTHVKPEKRNISIVYQDYALFPHMTVHKNIEYGLRFKKKDRDQEHFNFLVEMLGIEKILHRYPYNLSGGEKQRVALARALVVKPDILLLDEPFSALDISTKEMVQPEIKKLHKTLKITTLMVTHNFSEVFFLADKAAIINGGRIRQMGRVEEIFKRPNSKFTAQFVGMKNIFPLKRMKNHGVALGNLFMFEDVDMAMDEIYDYYMGLRPEDITIGKDPLDRTYQAKGVVTDSFNNGIYSGIRVLADDFLFTAYYSGNKVFELDIHEGDEVYLGFDRKDVHFIFDNHKS